MNKKKRIVSNEVLFRGKLIDRDEWAVGYYIKAKWHWHNRGIHEDWIVGGAIQNGGFINLTERYPVVPETVGQFTGLYDEKGERIFEGDILVYKDAENPEEERSIVVRGDGCWELKYENFNYSDTLDSTVAELEVIVGKAYNEKRTNKKQNKG